jgi:hypothetical protein
MTLRSEVTQPRPAGAATAAVDDMGFTPMSATDFETEGAVLYPSAALPILPDLHAFAEALAADQAGIRLRDNAALNAILSAEPIRRIVGRHFARRATREGKEDAIRPVRAILFDKTANANWSLHDVPGFGPWSRKAGLQHVEPPFALIEAMLTLRIHIDDVPADNAPLLIAPGSHRLGRVPETEIDAIVERCGTRACLASAGDVWAYATAILHASRAATRTGQRRVLQVDYSACDLPEPLVWRGV